MTDWINHPLVKKGATVVFSAALGFAGNTVLQNKMANVRQDAQIHSLQRVVDSVPSLNDKLSVVSMNLSTFNQKLTDLIDRINRSEAPPHVKSH